MNIKQVMNTDDKAKQDNTAEILTFASHASRQIWWRCDNFVVVQIFVHIFHVISSLTRPGRQSRSRKSLAEKRLSWSRAEF